MGNYICVWKAHKAVVVDARTEQEAQMTFAKWMKDSDRAIVPPEEVHTEWTTVLKQEWGYTTVSVS